MTSALGLYILEERTFLKEQVTENEPIQLHCSGFFCLSPGQGKREDKRPVLLQPFDFAKILVV